LCYAKSKEQQQLTAVSEERDVDVVTNGNEPQRVADETRDVGVVVDKY